MPADGGFGCPKVTVCPGRLSRSLVAGPGTCTYPQGVHPDSGDTATWIGALGTCAAVIVALFGPSTQRWLRRPKLMLQDDPDEFVGNEAIFVPGEDPKPVTSTLLVVNRGRTQADDVQAIVTVHQRVGPDENEADAFPEFELPAVSRGSLRFELADREPGVSVPPRAARVVQFIRLGTDRDIRAAISAMGDEPSTVEYPSHGMFCVWPSPGASRFISVPEATPTRVTIELQARNARASAWEARIAVSAWGLQGEEPSGEDLSGVKLKWLTPLRRAKPRIPPTPRRQWLRAHTPRALLRERAFRRYMEEGATDDQTLKD